MERELDDSEILARIALGESQLSDGRHAEAVETLSMLYGDLRDTIGEEQRDTVTARGNLAMCLRAQGALLAAMEHQVEVLRIVREYTGPDSEDTLTAENNLALMLLDQGNFAEALPLQRHVFEKGLEDMGPDDSDVLTAQGNLALTLAATGELQSARAHQEQVLQKGRATFGDNDHRTVLAMQNLAMTLKSLGQYSAATSLQEQALAASEVFRGVDHPDTLLAAHNLTEMLYAQGDVQRAAANAVQVFERIEVRLGEDHQLTLVAAGNVGSLMLAYGDLAGARVMLTRSIKLLTKQLGADHPMTLAAETNLATVMYDQDHDAQSAALRRRVLARMRRVYGVEHPITLKVEGSLASMLPGLGDLEGGRKLGERVLAASKRVLGDAHPGTLDAAFRLARILRTARDYPAAIRLLEDTLPVSEATLGRYHQDTLNVLGGLVQLLHEAGNRLAALRLSVELLHRATEVGEIGDAQFALVTYCVSAAQFASRPKVLQEDRSAAELRAGLATLLPLLSPLSGRLQHLLEVRRAQLRPRAEVHFLEFHERWLQLCLVLTPEQCGQPIAILHGLEAWTDSTQYLLGLEATGVAAGPRAEHLAARLALSEIRNRLVEVDARLTELVGHDPRRWEPRQLVARVERHPELAAEATRCIEQEKAAALRYEAARKALVELEPALLVSLRPDWDRVLRDARLADDETVVVLFSVEDDHGAMVCNGAKGRAGVVALPLLDSLRIRAATTHAARAQGGREVGLRNSLEEDGTGLLPGPSRVLAPKGAKSCEAAFWQLLRELAPETRRWHLVTGPGLHDVVVAKEQGEEQVRYYAGLPAFHRMRLRQVSTQAVETLAMAVDAAWDTSAPLPFVETEALLVESIMARHGVRCERRAASELLGGHAQWIHVACHGRLEGRSHVRHGTLMLDMEKGTVFDGSGARKLPIGTREMFASACVAGVVGRAAGGDALGLPSALSLQGIDLVGCLLPMPDLYMPILAALYWENRLGHAKCAPDALDLARAQLQSGDWPLELAALIRRAYRHQLDKVLKMVARLVARSDAWKELGPLPKAERLRAVLLARQAVLGWGVAAQRIGRTEVASLSLDARLPELRPWLQQWLRTTQECEAFAEQVLQNIVDRRRDPIREVQKNFAHLVSYTRCWGC